MTFTQSQRELKRVGCGLAEGDSARCMYAQLIADTHGGKPQVYYKHLQGFGTFDLFRAEVKRLLNDRATAWDVLIK